MRASTFPTRPRLGGNTPATSLSSPIAAGPVTLRAHGRATSALQRCIDGTPRADEAFRTEELCALARRALHCRARLLVEREEALQAVGDARARGIDEESVPAVDQQLLGARDPRRNEG